MNEYTEEQKAVINAESEDLYISACPGAGKTTVIAQRFIKRAENNSKRKGIAALSFTNVAVEKIQTQCLENKRLHLVEYPNFVGTFDAFINRYLIMPFGSPYSKKRPRIIESWDGLIQLTKNRGKIKNQEQRVSNEKESLQRNGFLTSDDCRQIAEERLKKYKPLGHALASRFGEIIVDEVQDCNDIDLNILGHLREAGVKIIAIGDPDQGIYEFRGSTRERLEEFTKLHRRLELTHNWRSTQNICKFSAILKGDSLNKREPDQAKAEHSAHNIPIYLLNYENKVDISLIELFLEFGKTKEVNNNIILAYKHADACSAIGIKTDKEPTSNIAKFANYISFFKNPNFNQRECLNAIKWVEKFLLSVLKLNEGSKFDIKNDDAEDFCRLNNISYRWLRRCSFNVLFTEKALPSDERKEIEKWYEELINFLGSLNTPSNTKWESFKRKLPLKEIPIKTQNPLALKYSTIHKVKGEEFDAVLVIVPCSSSKKKATDKLLGFIDVNDEQTKKTYYVAFTRAKKLLALAVHDNIYDEIKKILIEKEILYEPIDLKKPEKKQKKKSEQNQPELSFSK